MKNLMLIFMFVFVAVGCSKKSNTPTNSYIYGANGQYTWNGSACVDRYSGQAVPQQYCTQTGQQGYGQQACAGQTQPTQVKQCYGQYVWLGNGYPQAGTCNGYNCANYTMCETATNQ